MRAWPCLGSLILVACGGSSNDDDPTGPTPPAGRLDGRRPRLGVAGELQRLRHPNPQSDRHPL
jgi:hypothetical protein